jgi:hypothetical protein
MVALTVYYLDRQKVGRMGLKMAMYLDASRAYSKVEKLEHQRKTRPVSQ